MLSLIPPLLTICMVFFTQNVVLSLILGVFSAAFIVARFSPLQSLILAAKKLFTVLELGNLTSIAGFLNCEKLLLFMFLLVLGIIIALIAESGEGYGYVERLCSKIRTKADAQFASIFLSATLFIDDYLNALTTSSVMRNLTDRFGIPRMKLAFLTTALAAPLCSLVPITSWAAAIIMFLFEAGISPDPASAVILADPFTTFCKAVPFIFFSIFLIAYACFVVATNCSYGIIAKHEAQTNIAQAKEPVSFGSSCDGIIAGHSSFNFFSPLLVISAGIFFAMLATGGFFTHGQNLIGALTSAKAELSLLIGALVGLGYTLALFFIKEKIGLNETKKAFLDGFFMMKDSLLVLALAWTLANFMTKDLGTGKYLAQTLMPFLSYEFLPLSVFLMGAFIAFSIGSAWATMAVIFPMVIPMVAEFSATTIPVFIDQANLVYPTIGAIISGAIFGSSLSPIADLLVITSKNTGVSHFEYVKAQMQYLLPVGIGSALAFAVAGILFKAFSYASVLKICLPLGFLVTIFTFSIIVKIYNLITCS